MSEQDYTDSPEGQNAMQQAQEDARVEADRPRSAETARAEEIRAQLEDARKNERHRNHQETVYWLNQYKRIASEDIPWLLDQLRAAQEDRDAIQIYADEKRDLELRLREHIERDKGRIAELETALQARASSGATTCHSCSGEMHCDFCYGRPIYDPAFGDDRDCACGHPYRRHFDGYEQNRPVGCKYCGCTTWKDPQTGAAPPVATTPHDADIVKVIPPFQHPGYVIRKAKPGPIHDPSAEPVATAGPDETLTCIAAGVEAIQTKFSATLGHTHSNGDDQPDDYAVLSIAILALRRLAKSSPSSPFPTPPPDAPTRG